MIFSTNLLRTAQRLFNNERVSICLVNVEEYYGEEKKDTKEGVC